MKIDLHDLLTLSTVPGIGSTRLINLLSHFKDSHLAIKAPAKELVHVPGIEKKTALNFVNFFRDSGADHAKRFVDEQLSRLNKAEARVVSYWDKEFPPNLKNIYDPPAFLFVRGKLKEIDRYSVALVGTRTATEYGRQMAEKFSHDFAKFGITTVSGLARGIDTVVHASTLKGGGRTIGVVGSGVDVMYPPENRDLAEKIIDSSAIISEFNMGAKPDAQNFPRRNRIVSGISLGTIIIETAIEGGAMITASLAFDQNREVFAVPGMVSEKRTSGSNLLIKQEKAILVESVEDVLSVLASQLKPVLKSPEGKKKQAPPQLSIFEQRLYEAMDDSPIHIDALAEKSGFSTADALVQLLSLEFKGVVRQSPGKMFRRVDV